MHTLLLVLAIYAFGLAVLYTFGDFLPFRWTKSLCTGYLGISELIYQYKPWLSLAMAAVNVLFILLWVKIGWMDLAGWSCVCLLIYEIGMWRIHGHHFHAD